MSGNDRHAVVSRAFFMEPNSSLNTLGGARATPSTVGFRFAVWGPRFQGCEIWGRGSRVQYLGDTSSEEGNKLHDKIISSILVPGLELRVFKV